MKNISTRLLMTCAAIGVAGGVLFTVHAWFGFLLANALPLVYGLTIGMYFVPGALVQALFRRPGVGFLTSALSGLVASPFQPIFFGAFLISLAIGVLQELPFLVGRYRYWKKWVFLVGSLLSGAIMTGAAAQVLGSKDYGLWGNIVIVVSFFVSPPLFTMFAVWLADRLIAAGVGRGLRLDEDRRQGRAPQGSQPSAASAAAGHGTNPTTAGLDAPVAGADEPATDPPSSASSPS